jgi:very-short-patch-repair endonuclease
LNTTKTYVDITCHECKQTTSKQLYYLLRRIRVGKTKVFCSRECTDLHHSKQMKGTKNPNFNGKWHGPDPKTILTKEERQANVTKQFQKYREDGTFENIVKRLNEGHTKYFSTPEGKKKRIENGVKAMTNFSKNKRTSIEIKMAEELALREIEYIEQYNLGNKFALDFFLPEYNIVIECDGDYWHRRPEAIGRDKSRNAYIKACGFPLFRFWESEINTDVEACVDVVMAEINAREAI